MYINFQQNRANRSVITMHTNVFAKNRKLHELQLPIIFLKINSFRHASSLNVQDYKYIVFQQNRVSRSVKTVHTNLLAKICKLH